MNKRNKTIALTSLLTLALIVFIGVTYTFFTALVTGDQGSNTIVQTANMNLLFTDHGELRMNDVLPGAYVTKQFEVANTGDANASYNIRWKGIFNEFINSELTLKLECTAYNSSNVSQGSCGNLEDIVGYSTSGAIKASIPIATDITHRYTITITFIETGENQNYNQGKSFNGTLLIDTLDLNETSIKGILVDESNNILANKVIEVHSDPISTITNSKGEFLLEGIEYGNHEIVIKDNNTEIARKNIVLTTTNNNTSVSDSTSIHWNETQKSVVKLKIETNTNSITRIDIDWMTTDSRCFAYDSASTSITDYYCYRYNTQGLPTITDVIIPSTVTSIGNNAFRDNQLTSVVIPNSVTSIGWYTFQNNQLTSVTIPDSVTSIGSFAFSNNNLTSVTIPDSVKTIAQDAFAYNQLISLTIPDSVTVLMSTAFAYNNLTSVVIPNSVISIGDRAFKNNKLTNIDYPGGITIGGGVFNENPIISDDPFYYYKKKDGSYDKTIIIGYINDGTSSVIIPDSVSEIKSSSFYGEGLTSVTIPNSVMTIGSWAFSNNNLTSVTIPNSVKTIAQAVFENNQLASVTIPNGVTTIGYGAFQNNQLASVTIPNSVTSIGSFAFYYNKLTSVTIPNSVTSIGYGAFQYNQLTSVTIPDSVTSIGNLAFYYNKLTSVTIPNSVKTIGTNAFQKTTTSNPNLSLIEIDNVSGAIEGSPWGAEGATIKWLKDS